MEYLCSDHPRIRGEHPNPRSWQQNAKGSSPHTRGALDKVKALAELLRIIPAYAGSTRPGSGRTVGPWDHPRIRGEHAQARLRRRLRARIIPAYAGSTRLRPPGRRPGRDHPRIRGEHSSASPWRLSRRGSSPHTRGARHVQPPPVVGGRIIPAYAGSTAPEAAGQDRQRDHPRIRGEHLAGLGRVIGGVGSSPHTRGARAVLGDVGPGDRIIPAYAGSTWVSEMRASMTRDHPRIRGEHLATIGRVIGGVGSSPHTRGAPDRTRPGRRRGRIIPAYAGSTTCCSGPGSATADHPRIRGEHGYQLGEDPGSGGSSPHTRGAPGIR